MIGSAGAVGAARSRPASRPAAAKVGCHRPRAYRSATAAAASTAPAARRCGASPAAPRSAATTAPTSSLPFDAEAEGCRSRVEGQRLARPARDEGGERDSSDRGGRTSRGRAQWPECEREQPEQSERREHGPEDREQRPARLAEEEEQPGSGDDRVDDCEPERVVAEREHRQREGEPQRDPWVADGQQAGREAERDGGSRREERQCRCPGARCESRQRGRQDAVGRRPLGGGTEVEPPEQGLSPDAHRASRGGGPAQCRGELLGSPGAGAGRRREPGRRPQRGASAGRAASWRATSLRARSRARSRERIPSRTDARRPAPPRGARRRPTRPRPASRCRRRGAPARCTRASRARPPRWSGSPRRRTARGRSRGC